VKVLFKPKPEYTAAAREQRIEGEVLLEVVFRASGDVTVLRVVQRLGHGLDETAVEAARRIRFEPARAGGRAVDSTAIVRILFQLAF
jgi:TonB family protein